MSFVTDAVLARLEALAGPANFSAAGDQLAACGIDGTTPAAVVAPGTPAEAAEVLRLAAHEKLAVIPLGRGTKPDWGAPPARYDVALRTTRLGRVLSYDPGDLTLSVEAGITLAGLQAELSPHGQFLPLDPPFAAEATIGGILAANSSGPLRHAYGTARDFVLGIEFFTGEGTPVRSGGRVVKNVAGYDIHKLMIGALGTLGVITSVNFRTFPIPRTTSTLVALFPDRVPALELRRGLAASFLQPRAVEIVSPRTAKVLALPGALETAGGKLPEPGWALAVAVGGHQRVVERHLLELEKMARAAGAGALAAVCGEEEARLWQKIRQAPYAAGSASEGATVVKISVLPGEFSALLDAAEEIARRAEMSLAAQARAMGVIYLTLIPAARGQESLGRLARACAELFDAAERSGGRAFIERCATALKRLVNVWGPPREDFALMQRLKRVFDPQGVLSPGRFVGGL